MISPQKITLGLRYQRTRWWGEARARFVFRQNRITDSLRLSYPEGIPGFTVYDLRGGYDFAMGLGFVLALENFTDELYAETYNNRPEPGRNLRIAARYRF